MQRLMRRLALGGALAAALGSAAMTAQAQATPLKFAYRGEAYGSYVKVGTAIQSGPTFRAAVLPCTAKAGDVATNSGASVNVPNILGTGTITNTVSTYAGATMGYTRSTAAIQKVNVLDGLIKASAVNAVSRTAYTTGSGFSFSNGSSFVGLTVAGKTVTVRPNLKISIPNLGYVLINQQIRSVKNGTAEQTVNMIHLVVTVAGNVYGLSPGANIIVGHARAAISTPIPGGPVGGVAFGTRANVGSTLLSGPSALVGMSCLGGSATRQIAGVTLPNIGSSKTIRTSTASNVGSGGSTAFATSTVETVRLLNGLIKADAVRANIQGSFNGSLHTFSDKSTFTTLVVNGNSLSVKANTVVEIPNLGTLYLHHVIRTTRSLTVRMIELNVTKANVYGLAIGTHVQVGVTRITFRD